LEFPIIGPGDKLWALSEPRLAEWRTSFPTIDVVAEGRKALAWLNANPTKRKTGRGMPKFFVSWLTRATDSPRRGSNAAAPAAGPSVPDPEQTRQMKAERGYGRRPS
jgi:hypothetical protein